MSDPPPGMPDPTQPEPAGASSSGAQHPLPISLAASSLVLGIVGLALSLFCYVGIILSVPAVVTGVMALRQVNAGTAGGRGLALAGIATGAFAIMGFLALILVLLGA